MVKTSKISGCDTHEQRTHSYCLNLDKIGRKELKELRVKLTYSLCRVFGLFSTFLIQIFSHVVYF